MITDNEIRLVVNVNELRRSKPTRAHELVLIIAQQSCYPH